MLSAHLRMYALSAIQRNGQKNKKGALRKAEQLTVRLRTRWLPHSKVGGWCAWLVPYYWIVNYNLDDYFNWIDCKSNLLPALRAFGEPLCAICLLRSEQLQTAQVRMLSGIEEPPSLADRTSNCTIWFRCTIHCWIHAYPSFLIPCLTSILYADNPLLEQDCLERLRQTRPRSGGACSGDYGIDDGFII